jgi:hypothetical protein
VVQIAHFYRPAAGLTALEFFGERFAPRRLKRLKTVPIYTLKDSWGYDGQFYAQLAVAGNPFDPELRTALDAPAYRSKRILLPALAHVVGLGRPSWVLNVYAVSNLLCWLVLAALTARWWFPPTDLQNLLRWTGTLFSAGMVVSVTRSLTDAPALLCVACGVRWLETERFKLGSCALALAGLVRESSIIYATALIPTHDAGRAVWGRRGLAIIAVIAPTAVWGSMLVLHFRGSGSVEQAFGLPFASLIGKVRDIAALWRLHGFASIDNELWAVLALTVQCAFIALYRRPQRHWWRIGATSSLLFVVLGPAVWEGTPSAAARAVLPLTLAFNVLVPRTRAWLVLLVAGNLTALSAPHLAKDLPPGAADLQGGTISVRFEPGWWDLERLGQRTWRWSPGATALRVHNPRSDTYLVTLDFEVSSVIARSLEIRTPDAQKVIKLPQAERISSAFGPFPVPPGDTVVRMTTDDPPWTEPGPIGRKLAFAIYGLRLTVNAPRAAEPMPVSGQPIK